MLISRCVGLVASVLILAAEFAYADASGNPAAVRSEDGEYFDKDGNPTFNVAKDGTSIGIPLLVISATQAIACSATVRLGLARALARLWSMH